MGGGGGTLRGGRASRARVGGLWEAGGCSGGRWGRGEGASVLQRRRERELGVRASGVRREALSGRWRDLGRHPGRPRSAKGLEHPCGGDLARMDRGRADACLGRRRHANRHRRRGRCRALLRRLAAPPRRHPARGEALERRLGCARARDARGRPRSARVPVAGQRAPVRSGPRDEKTSSPPSAPLHSRTWSSVDNHAAPCSSSAVSTSNRNFLICAGEGSSIESPMPLAMEKAMSALDTLRRDARHAPPHVGRGRHRVVRSDSYRANSAQTRVSPFS